MDHDSDRDEWVLDEQSQSVVLKQHFELTTLELQWLGAVAGAVGRSVEAELSERGAYSVDEGPYLCGFEDNPYVLGAAVMDAALTSFAAKSPPAPRPFRVNADFTAKGKWRGRWASKADPWTSFNTLSPRDAAEWDLAADRWRNGLDAEGRVLFDQALERALALYGEECARFVKLAAEHVADDGTPKEASRRVYGDDDTWGEDE